ncbi:MAG: response regulator [Phycisphaerales bacterium]|nr:response regulator [Hyphomonadaceae bacterium]
MKRLKPKILLIEDDTASAEALGMILRDWGAEVAHAPNADMVAAIPSERMASFGYIITDFNIGPGVDGVTLASQIAARAPDIKIMVLSGSFHGQATVAAKLAGFKLMQKPAHAEAILAWLDQR